MRVAWIEMSGAVLAAALTLLAGAPLDAADQTGVHYVAEELGNRTKPADAEQGGSKGLSDSAVSLVSTLALSILPDKVPGGPNGQVKLDKSDPNKFLIPIDDARKVIRVATRSAYAEVCKLMKLKDANFQAMMRTEKLHGWTSEQMMFIQALHMFATAYFSGNLKIKESVADSTESVADSTESDAGKSGSAATDALRDYYGKEGADAAKPKKAGPPANKALLDYYSEEGGDAASTADETPKALTPKQLECPPGQQEKVTAAINAYVQSAPPPQAASTPPAAAAAKAVPGPATGAGTAN